MSVEVEPTDHNDNRHDEDNLLDNILIQMGAAANTHDADSNELVPDDFSVAIESFDNIKKENPSMSIFEYWEKRRDSPLYNIATTILSVPCTQVSVERSFSALKFVYSDLREKLSNENIENILLIRLNDNNS